MNVLEKILEEIEKKNKRLNTIHYSKLVKQVSMKFGIEYRG